MKIVDALNHTTQITAHTGGGYPTTILDPNGVKTTRTYDGRQRLSTNAVTTTAGVLTTTWTYDKAGNLTQLTLPDSSYRLMTYDNAHRLTQIADNSGAYRLFTLDNLGDATAINEYSKAGGAAVASRSATFDSLGRILDDTSATTGKSIVYTWDGNGNPLTVTDGNGYTTKRAYDALNRVSTITDAASNKITVTYDLYDHPLKVTDQDSHSTSYVYDGFGERIETVSPDSGKTIYYYDLDGNLSETKDADGRIANRTYDALDRLLTVAYPGDSAENATLAWDQAGHGFGVGRLTGVNDALGTWSPSYDERGNLLTESRVMGGVTLNTAYSYDAASRISGITYPSGWIAKYARNAQGEVTGVTAAPNSTATPSSIVGSVAYLGLGEADTGLTFGNGVTEARGYDLDLRPTTLVDTGNAGALVQSLTYGYDYADNVKAVTDMVNGANTQAMNYDQLNRIKTASGGYGAYAWTYDNVGNRLTEQLGSNPASQYTYTPGTNRLATYLSGGVTQTYTYTQGGNIAGSTSKPKATPTAFTYNQAGRLATTSIPNAVGETLAYDWRGQMLTRTLAGDPPTVEQFQYGPANHLLEEDTGGVAEADYVYLGDRPVAAIAPASGTISYLHDDRLDTPQKATASSQAVAWAAVLNPFGVGTASGSIQQDLRMTGMFADANTALLHNGYRDLVPGFGRYLETDPIGLSGGMNTYGYVGQNPLSYVDPSGLLQFNPDGTISFSSSGSPMIVEHSNNNIIGREYGLVVPGVVYADDGTPIQASQNIPLNSDFDYDCHGMTFGGSQVWINNDQVDNILMHDNYTQASDPQPGDAVVYRDPNGNVVHSTTIISVNNPGGIYVIGKGGVGTPAVTTIGGGWNDPTVTPTVYRKKQ